MGAETPKQQLETPEDLLLLTHGDVVETGTLAQGLNGPMVVSKDSPGGKIRLIQRLNPAEIFKIDLTPNDVRVENGQLKFDPCRGGIRVNVLGNTDWVEYSCLMKELQAAGLEQ